MSFFFFEIVFQFLFFYKEKEKQLPIFVPVFFLFFYKLYKLMLMLMLLMMTTSCWAQQPHGRYGCRICQGMERDLQEGVKKVVNSDTRGWGSFFFGWGVSNRKVIVVTIPELLKPKRLNETHKPKLFLMLLVHTNENACICCLLTWP